MHFLKRLKWYPDQWVWKQKIKLVWKRNYRRKTYNLKLIIFYRKFKQIQRGRNKHIWKRRYGKNRRKSNAINWKIFRKNWLKKFWRITQIWCRKRKKINIKFRLTILLNCKFNKIEWIIIIIWYFLSLRLNLLTK